jgi:myo-inositol-hexaphosphate 3-phosphohydrolase
VGSFAARAVSSIETVLADDYYQVVYVPDENGRTGIYAFEPDGAPHQRNNTNRFGGEEVFQSDAEGIVLYTCRSAEGSDTGRGFIVVADQRDELTDLEFFDRRTWEHLGTVQIEGVWNTDGLASTQQPLPDYPLGILAAVHNDKTTVGVGWDKFFETTGASCAGY